MRWENGGVLGVCYSLKKEKNPNNAAIKTKLVAEASKMVNYQFQVQQSFNRGQA